MSIVQKVVLGSVLTAAGFTALDVTTASAQYPFNDDDCPNPKIAMMTNLGATFLNMAGPHFLESDAISPETAISTHARITEDLTTRVDECYAMPSNWLVELTAE